MGVELVTGRGANAPTGPGDQSATIAFLSSPSTHGGAEVTRIGTHASLLFLAGDRAWKLKRAVHYDYLDYSTPAKRRAMCEAEFAINRPAAPQVYRRVVAVCRRSDGTLALDGPGDPVDWLIEMTRFDQDELFDRLAERGALDLELMASLGPAIAHAHELAERRTDRGGYAGMRWVIDGNAAAFAADSLLSGSGTLSSDVTTAALRHVERLHHRLDDRRQRGFVRRCHGDLHLGNIVRFQGVPTLFDAVEFNDAIACVDVMYDVAFLLMDLERRHLRAHANTLLNSYLGETLDVDGLSALPLFLGNRAAVRAKTTSATAALETDPHRQTELVGQATAYLALAMRLLTPSSPCLIAVGGLSGSGKSALARSIAPEIGATPGAVLIRSDEFRKQLFGVAPLSRLGAESYTPRVSARVYELMLARAGSVLAENHAVVVDATFLRAEDRASVEAAAHDAGVPFVGLWLEAPEGLRLDRVRRRFGDPSDADASVLLQQRAEGAIGWERVDATGPMDRLLHSVREVLRSRTVVPAG